MTFIHIYIHVWKREGREIGLMAGRIEKTCNWVPGREIETNKKYKIKAKTKNKPQKDPERGG